jgi:arylsulfatase A-like enzyme
VLELLGLEIPAQVQGRSLFGALEGEADPLRPVFSEARMNQRKQASSRGQLVAVRRGGWKLIYNRTNRKMELYHLEEDPAETRNLAEKEPERARDLLRLISAYDRDSAARGHAAKGQESLPPDVVEGLRALGYVN